MTSPSHVIMHLRRFDQKHFGQFVKAKPTYEHIRRFERKVIWHNLIILIIMIINNLIIMALTSLLHEEFVGLKYVFRASGDILYVFLWNSVAVESHVADQTRHYRRNDCHTLLWYIRTNRLVSLLQDESLQTKSYRALLTETVIRVPNSSLKTTLTNIETFRYENCQHLSNNKNEQ